MAMNVTPFQSTDEFTMDGFNGKIAAVNSDVDSEIASALTGFARIETGSYVGTGTYGADNPNTLTFGFAPKLVIINNGDYQGVCWIYGTTGMMSMENGNLSIMSSIKDKTLSWYSTSSSSSDFKQLNISGRTYYYLAIG